HTPLRGKKKDLTELASKNANLALNEKFSLIEMNEQRTIQSVETLGDILHIEEPRHIEAFDNSNIQGTDPVSAMIVFMYGKVDKYLTSRVVIRSRYISVLKVAASLPDLIIVNVGNGLMSDVRNILENELLLSIPLAGLVKDDKHKTEEFLYGNPPEVIPLKRN